MHLCGGGVSAWGGADPWVVDKYRQASLEADRDALVDAVVSLLELPGKVLCYMRADRGRKRNAVIQASLESATENPGLRYRRSHHEKIELAIPATPNRRMNDTRAQEIHQSTNAWKEDRSITRCISLVREGYVGRAAKSLCQSRFLNPTDADILPVLR